MGRKKVFSPLFEKVKRGDKGGSRKKKSKGERLFRAFTISWIKNRRLRFQIRRKSGDKVVFFTRLGRDPAPGKLTRACEAREKGLLT